MDDLAVPDVLYRSGKSKVAGSGESKGPALDLLMHVFVRKGSLV